MPNTIRARLLLLMMTVLLPAIAAALFVVARTYQSEQDGLQRSLHTNAMAMVQVIDRELARRVDIGNALATSYLLTGPDVKDPDLVFLHRWATRIANDTGGWIELHSASHLLLDTRQPPGMTPRPHGDPGFRLAETVQVLPLDASAGDGLRPPQVMQPVRRASGELLNLVIVVPPRLLQQVVDQQRLPRNWVGAVLDSGARVVARHPGGDVHLGRLATPDLRALLAEADHGPFRSVSLDGMPSMAYFAKTPQGWAYVAGAPRDASMIADMPVAVFQVVAAALLLLALATGAALWVSRGIVCAAVSLEDAAQALQSGAPVLPLRPTGIVEFDAVGGTLAAAAQALGNARHDLERQVTDAVERTRQAEQRASRGQRIAALGRLTGGVAHDFNNLLGVISNSAHLIERHADAVPALQMPVGVTLRAVEMGSHLSRQLLRFGGRQPVSPRPVDLAAYLPELRELLQMVMRKAIPVAIEVAPGTESVKIDTSELELALINVALNARDAMPDGGRLQVQARNAAADETEGLSPGRYVLIAVTDTGCGMDDELAAQVFEPFVTTKGLGQGTGLGLSQVHGFCVQAGGTARMTSAPGQGSTVTLVLPACAVPPAATGQGEAPGAGAPGAGLLQDVNVLLVEDSEELAEVTVLLLQSYGCRVRRARHVDDALAQVAADASLQLVLSDVVMPGGRDGVDLARLLRRSHPQLPVVLISGYSAALTGLTGFTVLRKPVGAAQLVATLAAALRGAPAAAQSDS
jgi:signal transduction histidine kinase